MQLIKLVVGDSSIYVSFDMIYHNGMNSTEILSLCVAVMFVCSNLISGNVGRSWYVTSVSGIPGCIGHYQWHIQEKLKDSGSVACPCFG